MPVCHLPRAEDILHALGIENPVQPHLQFADRGALDAGLRCLPGLRAELALDQTEQRLRRSLSTVIGVDPEARRDTQVTIDAERLWVRRARRLPASSLRAGRRAKAPAAEGPTPEQLQVTPFLEFLWQLEAARQGDAESDADGLQATLDDHDIGHGVYYPRCIHEQPAYEGVSVSAPRAELAAKEVVSLPVHPTVDEADIQRIIEVITNNVE